MIKTGGIAALLGSWAVVGCAAPKPTPEPPPAPTPATSETGFSADDCYRGRVATGWQPGERDNADASVQDPQQARIFRKTIRDVLAQQNLAFWACARPPQVLPNADGYVATWFRTTADGHVAESAVVSAAGVSSEAQDCIGRALCLTTFPPSSGAAGMDIEQSFRIAGGAVVPTCYIGRGDVPGRTHEQTPVLDGGPTPPGSRRRKGSLDKDEIRHEVHRHNGALQVCYAVELVRDRNLTGRLVTQFAIGADGTVSLAGIVSSTMNAAAFEDCVGAELCSMLFPRTKGGGPVFVLYPFRFLPEP